MDLILNELSVEGQFFDSGELRESIRRVILMRDAAEGFGVEVYCHSNTANRHIRPETALIRALSRDQRVYITNWLTHGPFIEESQMHSSNEWYECDGEIVTDKGLGEAAYRVENGFDWRTLSFAPSSWERSPITVTHVEDDSASRDISVLNYWNMSELELALIEAEPKPKTWRDVEETARRRFTSLNFTAGSFSDMDGRPFALGVANRIQTLMNVLDRICNAGPDSPEGLKLLNDHFGHETSWFSNSAESEINKFRNKLTFPVDGIDTLCPWHGKINNPPYRIHFTWPVSAGKVNVVYVGWKRTV